MWTFLVLSWQPAQFATFKGEIGRVRQMYTMQMLGRCYLRALQVGDTSMERSRDGYQSCYSDSDQYDTEQQSTYPPWN